jgi:hypothetical protein
MDTLVNQGKLEDDSYLYSPRHIIDFGSVGTKDYCEIILIGEPMKYFFELDMEDIFKYVKEGMKKDGITVDASKLVFKTDDKGAITASIDMSSTVNTQPPVTENTEESYDPEEEIKEENRPTKIRRLRPNSHSNLQEKFEEAQSNIETTPSSEPEESPATDNSQEESPLPEATEEEIEQVTTTTFGNRKFKRRSA